jgi:hypothetical protein
LTRRHAIELSDGRWRYDVGRLIEVLELALGQVEARVAPPDPVAPPALGAPTGPARAAAVAPSRPVAAEPAAQWPAPPASSAGQAPVPAAPVRTRTRSGLGWKILLTVTTALFGLWTGGMLAAIDPRFTARTAFLFFLPALAIEVLFFVATARRGHLKSRGFVVFLVLLFVCAVFGGFALERSS